MNTSIVMGRGGVDIGREVRLWQSPGGLETKIGAGGSRRTKPIEVFVVHWTGSENSAKTVHRNLLARGCGIEWIIDRDGVIWQTCDPEVVNTYDANYMNARSVGVEVVCCGTNAKLWPKAKDRPHGIFYRDYKAYEYRDFLPQQDEALLALFAGVLELEPIERRFVSPLFSRVFAVPKERLLSFSGLLGHYHIRPGKSDPGPAPLRRLVDSLETDKQLKPWTFLMPPGSNRGR